MPAIILILIALAIYAIVMIGFQAWIGICLAMLSVMLLIALNEASVKQKKDDSDGESPKQKPVSKKDDDDNDFMGL
jgi:c-di-AMP phosphodiesterase-like protein